MTDCKQFATFYLNGIFFGVDVLKVQEVINYQEMTRVPISPTMVRGLINLRGQIVTAIDLRSRFEMPPLLEGKLPMNVVVRTDEGAVSLLVDEIGDVLEIPDDSFEQTPETMRGVVGDLIRGVYKLNQRMLLVLDTELTVSLPTSSIRAKSKLEAA